MLQKVLASCAASAFVAMGAVAHAQPEAPPSVVVSTPLRVNQEGVAWTECNIAVSQTNSLEAFVVAMADNRIASTSIFVLPSGAVLGHSTLPCGGGDPIVRAEPDEYNNCDWSGPGQSAVILDSGRIVAVQRDKVQAPYNRQRPYILYSDDGGASWLSNDAQEPIAIDPDGFSHPTTIGVMDEPDCQQPVAGDTPYDIDQRKSGPVIAVDRAPEPDHVYVAWYAKSAQNATNTDIWIAKSVDGGATWSSDPLFFQMQLTDAMLGVDGDPTTGVDQVMPAMAIDSCGGINLMFYDNRFDTDRNDRDEWIDSYFVRLTGFGPTAQVDHVERLTTETFPVGPCTAAQTDVSGFLGHYHHMDVSSNGRTLWFAYIARRTEPGGWSVKNSYAHRAVITCPTPTDLNGDGITNKPDAVLYTTAWLAQEPEADVNLDWIVDASDFVTFADWYAHESGQ